MAGLTAKQEAFCQAIAAGQDQSAAYKTAYSTRMGTSAATIAASASKLAADPKIATRIAEIRNIMAEKIGWTRNDSARVLTGIAEGDAPPTAKIAAVRELNVMFGLNGSDRGTGSGQNYTLTVVRAMEPIRDEDWL